MRQGPFRLLTRTGTPLVSAALWRQRVFWLGCSRPCPAFLTILSLPLNIRAQREEDEIQPVVAGCRARKTTGQETAAWWRPLNSSEWGRGHEGIRPERALPSSHARGRGSSQCRREKQLLIEILDLQLLRRPGCFSLNFK